MKKATMIAAAVLCSVVLFNCEMLFPTAKSQNYSLSYDANGATGGSAPQSGSFQQGTAVFVAGNTGNLMKTGYSFVGWNSSAAGSGSRYSSGDTITIGSSNIVLYAEWAVAGILTYDANGATSGSAPTDATVHAQGDSVLVQGNSGNLAKTGWTFAGWNTKADGSGATTYAGGAIFTMGSSAIRLYALWTQATTYRLTYDANGASGGSVPVDGNAYLTGASAPVLDNSGALTRSSYTFAGWDTSSSATIATYAAGSTLVVGSANVNLYAVWTQNPTWKVNYYANGGDGSPPNDPNNYQQSEPVTVLGNTNLTKTDYTFSGWSTVASGGVILYAGGDSFAMGTAAVSLFAQWVAVPRYSVTYDVNGASGVSAPVDSSTYLAGATLTVAGGSAMSWTSHAFIGWNTAASGSGTAYAAGATYTFGSENVTLFAVWAPAYLVVYDANALSATGTAPVDLTNYLPSAMVTVKGNTGSLAQSGYAFAGWNTAADGSGTTYPAASTFAIGAADVSLYAIWIPTSLTFSVSSSSKTITITGPISVSGGVVIPPGVTTIGSAAFQNATAMTDVSIPPSVTAIGASAFKGCSGLTAIVLPSSITAISGYLFQSCTSLQSISIPSSIASIGDGAFTSCTALTDSSTGQSSFTIPATVTNMGSGSFSGCTGITSVIVNAQVTSIAAFSSCTNLASITLPVTLTSIGDYAFLNCTALSSTSATPFTIPSTVTSIGIGAFQNCVGLSSVGSTPLAIPAGVTSIGSNAFQNCVGLSTIAIPSGVAILNGFYGCMNLATVTIQTPSSLTAVGVNAFYGCTSLTSINLPAGITLIDNNAFQNCSSLSSGGSTPFAIPAAVTTIGSSAFSGCSALASVSLPSGITALGDSAFNSCSSLTAITIPSGITSIGPYAFRYDTALASVSIPETVTSIGFMAFNGCSSLASVSIPASIMSIADSAFQDCSKLGSVSFAAGSSLSTIGQDAFNGCYRNNTVSLTALDIPSGVTSIGARAFKQCSYLPSVGLPSSLTTLGASAFQECNMLYNVMIPAAVTSIGDSAFYNCTNLIGVTMLPSAPPSLAGYIAGGTGAFSGCPLSSHITAPSGSVAAYKAATGWSEFASYIF